MREKKELYEEPLMKSFFDDPINCRLYSERHTNKEASKKLDERFAQFYLKVRLKAYTSKLTRHYSKEFDKKRRKQRNQLQIDQMSPGDPSESLKDKIPANELYPTDHMARNISDLLPTPKMKNTFLRFRKEKQDVLYHFIFGELSNKEISIIMNCSPQNISKLKRSALRELRGDDTIESDETESS